ncbi:DUF4097 family beta strand repeat-containing protein [Evansella sp. AB-rgal1]|uniref:DUF4097 family beta strand repeat-containing protein n=1 Tax=Evansella sp. AB-rgal1 TaxID=3242696 RepID=UPI00359DB7DF
MEKIGRWTAGIFFILIGVLFIFQSWLNISILSMLSFLWPIILFSLGVEFIYQYRIKEVGESLKFDRLAMTLLVSIVLISSALHSFQNSGLANAIPFFGENTSMEVNEIYSAKNIDSFSFETVNGAIELEGTDTDEIQIIGTVKSRHRNEKELKKAFESALEVKDSQHEFQYNLKGNSSFFSKTNNFTVDLKIFVPKELDNVKMRVTNGALQTTSVDGNVELTSVNGKISMDQISGNVHARTTNGAINLTDIGGSGEITTTNGKMKLKNMKSDLMVKGTNGAIEINSEVAGNWDIRTTNGRISIDIPTNSDAAIQGKTTNGSVDGNVQWVRSGDGARRNKEGTAMLNTGSFTIDVNNTNGSIHVNTR